MDDRNDRYRIWKTSGFSWINSGKLINVSVACFAFPVKQALSSAFQCCQAICHYASQITLTVIRRGGFPDCLLAGSRNESRHVSG
jgi:hypothetical protein